MSFKIKTKPKKPSRKREYARHDTDCSDISLEKLQNTIDMIIEREKEKGSKIEDITISTYGGYYDEHCVQIQYIVLESDISFNKRLEAYHKKLGEYNKWVEENAEAIAREKAERKRKADEKKALQEEYKQKLKELEKK